MDLREWFSSKFYIKQGTIKRKNHQTVTTEQVKQLIISDYSKSMGMNKAMDLARDFDSLLEQWIQEEDKEKGKKNMAYFENILEFITYELEIKKGLIMKQRGLFYDTTTDTYIKDMNHLVDELTLALSEYNEQAEHKLNRLDLKPAFNIWRNNLLNKLAEKRKKQLAFNNSYHIGDTEYTIDNWIEDLLLTYGGEPTAINIRMFKHLLFQIKCGAMDILYEGERIFFSFYAGSLHGQGLGKTVLFQKLCSPFPELYSGSGELAHFEYFNDLKAIVEDKALVDFQELSIPSHVTADRLVNSIKKNLTSSVIEGRMMYNSTSQKIPQFACFVSSTNNPIYEVLSDSTGMRRYWEFQLEPVLPNQERWDRANKMTSPEMMTEVYRCIDCTLEEGYLPRQGEPDYEERRKIQESYRKQDIVVRYFEENGIHVTNKKTAESKEMALTKLRSSFNIYVKKHRGDQFDWGMDKIKQKLRNMGVKVFTKNKTQFIYYEEKEPEQ